MIETPLLTLGSLMEAFEDDPELIIPIVLFVVGGIIAIVTVIVLSVKGIAVSRERERSRREIAAYIAEGSMTVEDGKALMSAAPEQSD